MKKEKVREDVQSMLEKRVKSGEIKTQADLDAFFLTLDMSLKTLEAVPIDVWAAKVGA